MKVGWAEIGIVGPARESLRRVGDAPRLSADGCFGDHGERGV